MTLLGNLVRSVENPAVPLTSTSLSEWLGGTPVHTGKTVGDGEALAVPTFLRGLEITAQTVAGLPLKVYEAEGQEVSRPPCLNEHRDRPQTTFEQWETLVTWIQGWGNAYAVKVRNQGGQVQHLMPIHPSRVAVDIEPDTESGGGYVKRFEVDGRVHLTAYDLMHLPGISFDGIMGVSRIGKLRQTLGLSLAAEEAAGRLYGNGLMVGGILTTDQSLNEDKSERLKNRWRAKYQGVTNAGEVAVLDSGAKYQQLALAPSDAQFLETRRFTVEEIARMLGLPGWMLGAQEKSTSWGTGMEQQFLSWVKLTLLGYTRRIEQRVTRELCGNGRWSQFKLEGLLRGDSKARAAFYNAGIVGGWMVPNDVRRLEDMPAVPWGDEPYLPHNTAAGDQPDDEPDDDDGGSDDDDDD